MPRHKLSEYQAKRIVTKVLGFDYEGYTETTFREVEKKLGSYVVKVDQAVKGRFKKGLVLLDVPAKDIASKVKALQKEGYSSFIIEPFRKYAPDEERYLSMMRDHNGVHLSLSESGGVDIESNADTIKTYTLDNSTDWKRLAKESKLSEKQLKTLVKVFNDNYFSFLEINPYIFEGGKPQLIDLAVEVDDAAVHLVDSWSEKDIRIPPRTLSDDEKTVTKLGEKSPASFAFQMINPNGSLFVLLSGGGASVTVCDEIYSAGYGKELANYGEYSGNPTEEETYIYTSAILRSLLKSSAKKKALFIGGAVANFTDIAKTFAGITRALEDYGDQLKAQGVRVVVRRGGPNQKAGLAHVKDILDRYGLTAAVYDQTTSIDAAVGRVIEEIA
jgi:ATP-citrate lyase beta-subunit